MECDAPPFSPAVPARLRPFCCVHFLVVRNLSIRPQRAAALETYMRRVYRAHEILDISVDTEEGRGTVNWSFRFRDVAPDQSPVSRVKETPCLLFISVSCVCGICGVYVMRDTAA